MSNETSKAVEQIYAEIGEQFGDRGVRIARAMQNAFASGLGSEPAENVNRREANDRAQTALLKAARDPELEFDTREGWPGFVYYVAQESGRRAVLGDKDSDPLMYKIWALAKEFHHPVAEKRDKDWFDSSTKIHGHESLLTAAVRSSMAQIRLTLLGMDREFPTEID
jgi:hypothetical protein